MAVPESRAQFEIVYDGPALADHRMDVRDLGPALLAIGDLCQAVNRAISGEKDANLHVKVNATSKGSFEIELELLQQVTFLGSLFGGQLTASDLVELIRDLLQFLKEKKGRRIDHEVEKTEDEVRESKRAASTAEMAVPDYQNKTVIVGDGNQITIDQPTYIVAADAASRAALRDLVDPVDDQRGINRFRMKAKNGRADTEITSEEVRAGYFDVVPSEVGLADQPIPPQTIQAMLTLRAPVFDRYKKWQFFYGRPTIFVTILDEQFTKRVFENGERFGVGDRFRVKLRITQNLLADGKLRNDYEIVEVSEVVPRPDQLNLV